MNELKEERIYNPVVPLNIFQTWSTKNLPPIMSNVVDLIKKNNPLFEHSLYDDNERRSFIEEYFEKDVLKAYDTLIPNAYKADLWRYCVLYIHGGIYLDVKFVQLEGFNLLELTEKEHFVKDREDQYDEAGKVIKGIFNGFIVSKSNNPILLQCIEQIVKNVTNRFYGKNPLTVTGPQMMIQFFYPETDDDVDLHINFIPNAKGFVKYVIKNKNNDDLFIDYDDYRMEQFIYKTKRHYTVLWEEKSIYKK